MSGPAHNAKVWLREENHQGFHRSDVRDTIPAAPKTLDVCILMAYRDNIGAVARVRWLFHM